MSDSIRLSLPRKSPDTEADGPERLSAVVSIPFPGAAKEAPRTEATAKRRSRRRRNTAKVTKPYPDYPLTPHPSGRWCKKIRGRIYYFGKVDDPEAALQKYLNQKDDLFAGRMPRDTDNIFTVELLCEKFLKFKRAYVPHELSTHSFNEYMSTCQRVIDAFTWNRAVEDLRPEDFEAFRAKYAEQWGPVRLGNEVQRVRSIFKYAFDAGHIDRPVRYGPGFKRPTKTALRIHKAKTIAQHGERMFTAEEIRFMLKTAKPQLRAMILLGCNGGLGNADVGTLPISALDLDAGWLNYARQKTGVPRRIPLWQETVEALRKVLAKRPKKVEPDAAGLVFVTKYGKSWYKKPKMMEPADGKRWPVRDNPVAKETTKLLNKLKLRRRGVGFYTLRHVFETIGGEARDQVAVNAIMGHADQSMASHYREHIGDERLQAVVQHVRGWLFGRNRRQK